MYIGEELEIIRAYCTDKGKNSDIVNSLISFLFYVNPIIVSQLADIAMEYFNHKFNITKSYSQDKSGNKFLIRIF